ncbi:MAG: glycerol-3-phosphate acyltransferase [Anaerolineae bacterium]|nr:glycerol-3-phosphate acyltransferase [Anaerolineae bacterium]
MIADVLLIAAAAILAYLIGSTPVGYLLGRLWGVNVLERGSGRTGGTNVLRSAGPMAALITGALDVGKGALAVWVAGQIAAGEVQAAAEILAGAAVILGHNHSIFLCFRGGAGVGTSLGALSVVYWPAALLLLILLPTIIAITRYASVGSLIVMTLMPILLIGAVVLNNLSPIYVAYGLLAWAIVVYSHRPNIRRLLHGTERRIGEKSKAAR